MNKCTRQLISGLAATHLIALTMAGTGMAATEDWKNYGQGRFGMLQPAGDFDEADYDTGAAFAATYGRYLTPNLIVEGSFEFATAEQESTGITASAGHYDRENLLSSGACLITLKAEQDLGPVRLFGGGGVGAYAVTLESDIETTRLGDFDRDDSDTVFGAHVVAGAAFDVTDRFFIGIEGLYRWTDEVDIDETVAEIPVAYNGDLSGYQLSLSAGFRF